MSDHPTLFQSFGWQEKRPRLEPAPVHTGEREAKSKGHKKRGKQRRSPHKRDTSEYYVNEPPPKDLEWFEKLNALILKSRRTPKLYASLRTYFTRWIRWLMLGLDDTWRHQLQKCMSTIIPSTLALMTTLS